MPRTTLARVRRRSAALGVAAGVAVVASACSSGETRSPDVGVDVAGDVSVYELRAGDCLDPDPELTGEVADMRVVPCDQPHTQEVFAVDDLEEGPYPGPEAVQVQADRACIARLQSDLGLTLADGFFVSYLLPTFAGWNREDAPDRRVVCVLVFPADDAVTGSAVAGTLGADATDGGA